MSFRMKLMVKIVKMRVVDYFIEREIGVKDKKYSRNQIYYIINFCLFGIHNKKKWFFLYVHVLDEREDV